MKPAVGIDIGGSKIALAVVAEHGEILSEVTIPTEAERPFSETLERMLAAIGQILQTAAVETRECSGIGVGCTGPLDIKRGLVLNPYILPGWDGVELVGLLSRSTGLSVALENDADAALLGEWFAGSGRGCDNLLMLTLGTGLGGAALSRGRLYRGANSEHPEIGHMPVDPLGPECYCGTRGCLEILASGEGIGKQGKEQGIGDSRAVFEQAAEGNEAARAILKKAVSAMQTAVWVILHTFLPDRLVLGGGIIEKHGSVFLPELLGIPERATMVTQSRMEIVEASLGNRAGVIGAASLAFRAGRFP